MSWRSEFFLATTSLENVAVHEDDPESFPAIDQINDWLTKNSYGWRFTAVTGMCHCFSAETKSIPLGFFDAVRAAPWQWREQVQLFKRDESEKGFTPIILWPDAVMPAPVNPDD